MDIYVVVVCFGASLCVVVSPACEGGRETGRERGKRAREKGNILRAILEERKGKKVNICSTID